MDFIFFFFQRPREIKLSKASILEQSKALSKVFLTQFDFDGETEAIWSNYRNPILRQISYKFLLA